jgi:diguanylate cyclase (GGDEF)-like protein
MRPTSFHPLFTRARQLFSPERRASPALGLMWLYLAAAVLTLLEVLTSDDSGAVVVPAVLAISAVSTVVAAGLLAYGPRVARGVIGGLVVLGGLLTSAEIHFTAGVPNAASLFYFWGILYAFYFFGRRQAVAQFVLVAVQYALVIALRPPAFSSVAHWTTTMAAMLGAGLFVGTLKTRLDGRIERLTDDARTDALTGLLNRRGFDAAIDIEFERARHDRRPLSLLIGDLDRFKDINDVQGHAAGDEVLRRFAAILSHHGRRGDTIARHGGEEFALILPDTDIAHALATAARLRDVVQHRLSSDGMPLTVSFGVATYPRHGHTPQALMHLADQALYAAKSQGRNRVVGCPEPSLS